MEEQEMALKFFYNGIKDNGGKLQLCSYSDGELISYPKGTLTIYARKYDGFSQGVHDAFAVENGTDMQTDYYEKDRIRVLPSHPLYAQVKAAQDAALTRYLNRNRRFAA